jgi:hypothetical protein
MPYYYLPEMLTIKQLVNQLIRFAHDDDLSRTISAITYAAVSMHHKCITVK